MDCKQVSTQLDRFAAQGGCQGGDTLERDVASTAQVAAHHNRLHPCPGRNLPHRAPLQDAHEGTGHQIAVPAPCGALQGGASGASRRQEGQPGFGETCGLLSRFHTPIVALARWRRERRVSRTMLLTAGLYLWSTLLTLAPVPCDTAGRLWRWRVGQIRTGKSWSAWMDTPISSALEVCDAQRQAAQK